MFTRFTFQNLQIAMGTLDRVVRGGLLIMTAPSISVIHDNGTILITEDTKAFYILDNITYLGSDLCQSTADRCRTGLHPSAMLCSSQPNTSTADLVPQSDLLSKVLQIRPDQQPAGWPCNVSTAVDPRILKLGHAPIFDFEQLIDFIHMESQGSDSEKSCASLRDLTLRGLPQGRAVPGSAKGRNSSIHWHPGDGFGRRLSAVSDAAAAAAAGRGLCRRLLSYTVGQGPQGSRMLTQGTPDVWTLMMWSITRWDCSAAAAGEVTRVVAAVTAALWFTQMFE
jgi:hypothetical protein